MSNKQYIASKNEYVRGEKENYQKISTSLYCQEKLQGFYKDYEIKDIQDWIENSVGLDGTP